MTQITPASARLIVPSTEFVAAYVEAQQHGGGKPLPGEIIEAMAGSVTRIVQRANGPAPAEQKIIYQQLWMVVDKSVIGRVSLRPRIGAPTETMIGHIAYEVRPAFRGRGFGHRALALGMETLRRQGVVNILLLCEEDNLASIRIIEAAGGALESVVPHRGFPERLIRRYWIRDAAQPR